jgi:MFS family permease
MSQELRLIRRITLKLIPFLILLYLIAYVDRSAVGFAKLHMGADVGIGDAAYGLGAGLFFIGYFLLEIPSNLMLERFGARRWFARIMITWGAITIGMAFVQGPNSFYVMRFLLGAAEAGLLSQASCTTSPNGSRFAIAARSSGCSSCPSRLR